MQDMMAVHSLSAMKVLIGWTSSHVMGWVMARMYVGWFAFFVLYIHAPICILMHWGQDLRKLWICCYTNF